MKCVQCSRPFTGQERVASISGSILGDEHTDAYFLCPTCDVYTVAAWHDNFTGTETVRISGPVSRTAGDERVGLIGACSHPWDKKCRCEAHRDQFRDALD